MPEQLFELRCYSDDRCLSWVYREGKHDIKSVMTEYYTTSTHTHTHTHTLCHCVHLSLLMRLSRCVYMYIYMPTHFRCVQSTSAANLHN